eukprot:scaffold446948_cov27-Prasinocladus_malaysianus.AAC.1
MNIIKANIAGTGPGPTMLYRLCDVQKNCKPPPQTSTSATIVQTTKRIYRHNKQLPLPRI